MATVRFVNGIRATTIAVTASSGAGTFTVTDGSVFPTLTGDEVVDLLVGGARGEICRLTAVSGNVLTVLRAQEGTNAVTHFAGEPIQISITAASLASLSSSVMPSGFGSVAASGTGSNMSSSVGVVVQESVGARFTTRSFESFAASGSPLTGTADSSYTSPAVGDVVALDESVQKWNKLSSGWLHRQIAVVTATATLAMYRSGKVTCGSGWTIGKTVWFVNSAPTQTPPALPTIDGTTLQIIVELGIAVSSTEIQLDIKPVITRMAGSLAVDATMTVPNPPDQSTSLRRRVRAFTVDRGVARWPLTDGSGSNASDPVGGFTGSLVGAPTWTTGHAGAGTGALTFNGSSNYVTAGSSQLTLGATTVAYWMNYAGSGNLFIADLVAIGTSGIVIYGLSGTTIIFGLRSETTSPQYTPATITGWHHVCWTYNGLGVNTLTNYKLYWDGVNVSISNYGLTGGTSPSNVVGAGNGGANPFNGSLGDIYILNKALTASQVLKIYNAPYSNIDSSYPVQIGSPIINSGSMTSINIDSSADTSTMGICRLGATKNVLIEIES